MLIGVLAGEHLYIFVVNQICKEMQQRKLYKKLKHIKTLFHQYKIFIQVVARTQFSIK